MKHKRIIMIILALVLLAAALGSCAQKDDTKKSNLVEPDGWVYYCKSDGLFKSERTVKRKRWSWENPFIGFRYMKTEYTMSLLKKVQAHIALYTAVKRTEATMC